MFNVCPECGAWGVERTIEETGDRFQCAAVCDACGSRIPFIRRPVYVVTGASGTGKTSACRALTLRSDEFVVLESDILWGTMDVSDEAGLDRYWNAWLRLIKNLNQAGRPVILCGTVVPEQLERLPERRYLGQLHYLALVTEPEEHARRLRARPAWRESSDPDFIVRHTQFNEWLVANAGSSDPGWSLLETAGITPDQTADRILAWAMTREAGAQA